MIALHHLKHKHVGVVGLGKAGHAAVEALHAGGARTYVWDDAKQDASLTPLDAWPWEKLDGVLLSPGVPLYLPQPHAAVTLAQKHHVPIWGEVDLLYRECGEATYIGITGTNGKSTTTALLGHVLQALAKQGLYTGGQQADSALSPLHSGGSSRDWKPEESQQADSALSPLHSGGSSRDWKPEDNIQIGGNLGTAALALEPLGAEGAYVIELSSYQLDLCTDLHCRVAIWLNLEPDHLARHGTMERYAEAKARIFAHQSGTDAAIIGCADEPSKKMAEAIGAIQLLPEAGGGWSYGAGWVKAPDARHYSLSEMPALQGEHNAQNAAAVLAAVEALGLDVGAAHQAMIDFPGLPHRMELVARVDGWQAVNDSKATNVAAAMRSLRAYDHIYWLVGGEPKEEDYRALLAAKNQVAKVYAYGQAAEMLSEVLGNDLDVVRYDDLAAATQAAMSEIVQEGAFATLLLAPACASFDQWENFEQRGNAFREIVQRGTHS